jgi:hypothetical protein
MTAAFAPAPQTTFVPRTLALVPEPAPTGGIPSIRVSPGPSAGSAVSLATVHHLPVRPSPAVYRRRRLLALSIALGIVLGVASFVQRAEATPTAEGQLADSITIVVQPGDTLWGIASTLDPDGDPRRLVDELEQIAGNGVLQPGQQLLIPRHVIGS